jgi:MFS family permease
MKWRTLLLLALAECLAMGLWFSASAVAPALVREWSLTAGQGAWLTMAVQLGFVAGALLSALFNVPDLWPPRVVVALGAFVGAALTALIPALDASFRTTVLLRFGTGMTLALVYPVGMKIMATWTREDRGLGLGLLVGALTVGSASPHLIRALGGVAQWRPVLYLAAGLAALGGATAWRYGALGPYRARVPPFQWRDMSHALAVRPLRLANAGYLGHMWELYAMWTWVPAFLLHAYVPLYTSSPPVEAAERAGRAAALAAFAVIAVGGLGSLLAGKLADRWGRTRTTMLSMVISGSCALIVGFLAERHAALATAVALLWGFAVVADSAQFSSSVSELSDPQYMGTQLTTQTCMGFLLTLASIQLVPVIQTAAGWGWAFAALAPGPALGTLAMWRLLRSSDAVKLAGGRG